MNDDVRVAVVDLTARDVRALRWAVPLVRGLEEGIGPQAGLREGEAMSDVLAAIAARADRAANQQGRCSGVSDDDVQSLREFLLKPGCGGTDYGLSDEQLAEYVGSAKARVRGRRLSWHRLALDQIRADYGQST